MSEDEIKAAVEGAFQALRCVAEIWDFGEKLKFCVYDRENCVYKVASCPLNLVRNKSDLESFLRDRRADVEGKGFTLHTWKLA